MFAEEPIAKDTGVVISLDFCRQQLYVLLMQQVTVREAVMIDTIITNNITTPTTTGTVRSTVHVSKEKNN